jgi:hypothetical protein
MTMKISISILSAILMTFSSCSLYTRVQDQDIKDEIIAGVHTVNQESAIERLPVGEDWTITFSTGVYSLQEWAAPIARIKARSNGTTVTLPDEYVWLRSHDGIAVVVDNVIYAQARRYNQTGIYRIVPGETPEITLVSRPEDDTFWWQSKRFRSSGPIFVVDTDHVLLYVGSTGGIGDVTVAVTPDLRHRVLADRRLVIWNGADGHAYFLRPETGEILRAALAPGQPGTDLALQPYGILPAVRLFWRTTAIASTSTRSTVIGIDTDRTFYELYRQDNGDADGSVPLRTASLDGFGMLSGIEVTPEETIAFLLDGRSYTFDPSSFSFQR